MRDKVVQKIHFKTFKYILLQRSHKMLILFYSILIIYMHMHIYVCICVCVYILCPSEIYIVL